MSSTNKLLTIIVVALIVGIVAGAVGQSYADHNAMVARESHMAQMSRAAAVEYEATIAALEAQKEREYYRGIYSVCHSVMYIPAGECLNILQRLIELNVYAMPDDGFVWPPSSPNKRSD